MAKKKKDKRKKRLEAYKAKVQYQKRKEREKYFEKLPFKKTIPTFRHASVGTDENKTAPKLQGRPMTAEESARRDASGVPRAIVVREE